MSFTDDFVCSEWSRLTGGLGFSGKHSHTNDLNTAHFKKGLMGKYLNLGMGSSCKNKTTQSAWL